MKVLITGSSGFVGRHLRRACVDRGDDVVAVDIDNGVDARSFFNDYRAESVDLVLHCAAIVGGRRLIDGTPTKLLAHNAQLDAAMFEWALETKPRDVVYYSSSAAYPAWLQERPNTILDEFDIDLDRSERPETSYGQAKLNGEQIARYARLEGQRVHVLRPFSGYGADQDLDYPFPSFIARARAKMRPFEVWGDGTQVRDWIHIDDIVGATLAVIDQPKSVTSNLCTGIGTDFATLALLVTSIAGYAPDIRYRSDKPSGVSNRVGDPSFMSTFYEPTISIEEGVKRALRT